MSKKVVIVDDSRTARQQVREALGGHDFEVLEAEDGDDGIRVIGENEDASVVLCDVNMPKMNGFEMVEALKPRYGAMQFLMLTTEAEPSLVRRAKEAGAKGWIVKPFKPDLLVAAVKRLASAP